MRSSLRLLSFGFAALGMGLSPVAFAAMCNVPSGSYPTIQSAANDNTCTEIVIAAGTYVEQITVGQPASVFVHGAGAGRTIIQTPTTRMPSTLPTTYHPNYTYIVQVPPGQAANFADLTIEGLSNAQCFENLFAVRFNNSNGSLDRVVVQNVRATGPCFGNQIGISVASTAEAGGSSTVSLLGSTIRNFQKVGVLFNGATAGGQVVNTVIHGVGAQPDLAQNGIQISGGASVGVQGNIINAIHYAPADYLVAGACSGVASGILDFQAGLTFLQQNFIYDVDQGIALVQNTGPQTLAGDEIDISLAGVISDSNSAGVVNITDTGVTNITTSTIPNAATCFPGSGDGIAISNESGSRVANNFMAGNARAGLEILAMSSTADVEQNESTRSGTADLIDGGSSDTFSLNLCVASMPASLCSGPP